MYGMTRWPREPRVLGALCCGAPSWTAARHHRARHSFLPLSQVRASIVLAAALNRTLILPRFYCGEALLSYPCYSWYHRAMGFRGDLVKGARVPMPTQCPLYYWAGARSDAPATDLHLLHSIALGPD